MSISKGDVVVSLAGRDKGKLFFVLNTDGQFAILADGKVRKLEKPKRKKLRHIQIATRKECHLAEKIRQGSTILDSELRRELAILRQDISVPTKEEG